MSTDAGSVVSSAVPAPGEEGYYTGSAGQWLRALCGQGSQHTGTTFVHATNGSSCTAVGDPSQVLELVHTSSDPAEQAALDAELAARGTTFVAAAFDVYGVYVFATTAPTQAPLEPLLPFGFRIDAY